MEFYGVTSCGGARGDGQTRRDSRICRRSRGLIIQEQSVTENARRQTGKKRTSSWPKAGFSPCHKGPATKAVRRAPRTTHSTILASREDKRMINKSYR